MAELTLSIVGMLIILVYSTKNWNKLDIALVTVVMGEPIDYLGNFNVNFANYVLTILITATIGITMSSIINKE